MRGFSCLDQLCCVRNGCGCRPHITALIRAYGESIISPISVRPTTGINSRTSSVAASRSNTNSTPRVCTGAESWDSHPRD